MRQRTAGTFDAPCRTAAGGDCAWLWGEEGDDRLIGSRSAERMEGGEGNFRVPAASSSGR